MRPLRVLLASATSATLLLTACPDVSIGPQGSESQTASPTSPSPTETGTPGDPTTPVPTDSPEPTSPPPSGPGSAAEARATLCKRPPLPEPDPPDPDADVPEVILEVQAQVEEARGLEFKHPVLAEAISHEELVERIDKIFDHSFPTDLYSRRTAAWQSLGVIPEGVDLRDALHDFLTTQVVGFYDPATKELVFIGTENPSVVERITLAHELTHAIDDQHFNLGRINRFENRCNEELLQAALGAVEGSAQFFSTRVSLLSSDYLDGENLRAVSLPGAFAAGRVSWLFRPAVLQAARGPGMGVRPAPAIRQAGDIPPFLQEIEFWPYIGGLRFIQERFEQGGLEAVNETLRDFPTSTEQVIHPEKYGADAPQALDVPDIGDSLGRRWRDLDVNDVGEDWLQAMFHLRLDLTTADQAAAGWDGGLYRTWTDGEAVAGVLTTAWDSTPDAEEFVRAVNDWISPGQHIATRTGLSGTTVDVLFGSNDTAVEALLLYYGREG